MTIDDLKKLPVITRLEMQDNPDFIIKPLCYWPHFTGGSTGAPLRYYESYEGAKIRWKAHLIGWKWNGYHPGEKLAIIASAQGRLGTKNTLHLIGDLTLENMKKNVSELIKFKPRFLRGYVGSLFILAKYCLDNNIEIEGIQSINTIAENLYDYQRDLMEKVFKCAVYEEYCCNDGGACAWECDTHEGLHYVMERAIVEEIDGEMIVTDLWNKAMPFIRYQNGDAVRFLKEKCTCGRAHPLIRVKGRTNDILISPEGMVSPTFMAYHGIGKGKQYNNKGKFRSGIRMVQYIQEPGYNLKVNIEKNEWCTEEEIKGFIEDVKISVGSMTVGYEIVDVLPATKKGKRQFVVNNDKELLKKWNLQ